jgi:hypothetical protein
MMCVELVSEPAGALCIEHCLFAFDEHRVPESHASDACCASHFETNLVEEFFCSCNSYLDFIVHIFLKLKFWAADFLCDFVKGQV